MTEIPYPADLTGALVTLRPWRDEDLPQRVAGFDDPLCLRYSWPGTRPPTGADTAAAFRRDEHDRLTGTALNLAIVNSGDPAEVWGGTSLYDIDPDRETAAIGYWLAAHARGRGAATATVGLLAAWAFTALGTARLELTCAPDNEASQRVAIRCGFVREGVLRSHLPFQGSRRDTMLFSLLPGELRH